MKVFIASLLVLSFPVLSNEIDTFAEAKKVAAKIFKGHETTIYCGCKYIGNIGRTADIVAVMAKVRPSESAA